MTAEEKRLEEDRTRKAYWRRWGSYLSERHPGECKPRLLQVSRLPYRVRMVTIDSLALRVGVQERIIVECDLPKQRPVARTPNPCVRTLIAAETTTEAVLSLAIGVFVR